jgi:hypothetical protein
VSSAERFASGRLTLLSAKFAVTFFEAFIFTLQEVLVPEQAPDQPAKDELEDGEAVRITDAPGL